MSTADICKWTQDIPLNHPATTSCPQDTLPLWQRLIFTTLIPTALLIAGIIAVRVYVGSIYELLDLPTAGPESAGQLYVIFALLFLAVIRISEVLILLLIGACTVRAAFRPWRNWHTAILGGLCAVLIGSSIAGALCFVLYLTLTRVILN